MRKILAVVALLCGAAGAYGATAPAKWCVNYTEDSVSLIKAPGIIYNLKLVGRNNADTEETEVWSTDDRSLTIAFVESDVFWYNGEKVGKIIADCP